MRQVAPRGPGLRSFWSWDLSGFWRQEFPRFQIRPVSIRQLSSLTVKENPLNIFVGNLARNVTEEDLHQAFGAFGQIASVSIIKDKFSGEPRGFGFVEMPTQSEAEAAITGLNGQELKGRNLNVNEARPRVEGGHRGGGRPGGGYGGGHGRRGGGGGGGHRSW